MYFEGGDYDPNELLSKVDPETGHEVIQRKGNTIPSGLVSLYTLFDKHDRYIKEQKKTRTRSMEHYDKHNIGMNEDPKLVNISNWCMEEEK